jgi:hypothetical protein
MPDAGPFVPNEQGGIDQGHAADDLSGAIRGDVPNFGRCTRDLDCAAGACFRADEEVGFCATICAAPATVSLGSFRVEPCAPHETCALVEGSLGLCTTPCTTDRDCPRARCTRFRPSGNFCGPSFTTDDEAPPPSSG